MTTYDRYTELLSKRVHRSITDAEQRDLATFETAQPKTCPRCHTTVRSSFLPGQIVHDVEKCDAKLPA
jgi:hypothetical protein